MRVIIRNTSDQPIYEQIREQLKQKIISGELVEGTKLPSIRYLAKELQISVITTKRAYEELERDGFIYTMQGKGSFVASQNNALLQEKYLKKIESLLTEAKTLAQFCDLSTADLKEMMETLEVEHDDNIRTERD